MALEKLQESLDRGLCHLYYGTSFLGVLAQKLYDIKDREQRRKTPLNKNAYNAIKLGFKHKPQFGFCSYLPDVARYKERTLQLMSSLNVKWLRTDFPYSMLRNEDEFAVVDEIVENACKKKIRLLPILGTWTVGRPRPPKDLRGFLRYVEKVVTRYNGKIDNYEFWNEPNCIWFWRDSVGEFCKLMNSAARKVKEVNSQIRFGINVAWHWSPHRSWALKFIQTVSKKPD